MSALFQKLLPATLRFIGVIQFALGAGFALAPEFTAGYLGLSPAPGWANWLLGIMAARFLAFGYGMWWAARNLAQARVWIGSMVFIQAVDWIVTLKYLYLGAVTVAQVSTAAYLPVVFMVVLWLGRPRQGVAQAATAQGGV